MLDQFMETHPALEYLHLDLFHTPDDNVPNVDLKLMNLKVLSFESLDLRTGIVLFSLKVNSFDNI